MTRKTIIVLLFINWCLLSTAQQPPGNTVRIADSLTAKEMAERKPVLLRTELDSLIKLYAPVPVDKTIGEVPPQKADTVAPYLFGGMFLLLLFSGVMLFILSRQRREFRNALHALQKELAIDMPLTLNGGKKNRVRSAAGQSPEASMEILNAELLQLLKENEQLQHVISEYNGIQHEFDSFKQGMQKIYKVKNYPGYDKDKDDLIACKNVLDTERAVADYAYEKFLRPVLVIADANKNNPAKMNSADRERLFDLLISLSFFYIEYLYLRVSDLAVGGNMVERLKALTRGHAFNPELLKQLNTEAGSRALVVRMALSKLAVRDLSYPVFDETNLNKS